MLTSNENPESALVTERARPLGPRVNVQQFLRRPVPGWFSVERIYADVRKYLPRNIEANVVVNRYPSKGFIPRLIDSINAAFCSGEVNHVLGDVHYVAWFLPRRRTIITVLDCVALEQTNGLRRFLLWLLWYWLPLKKARRVVVISEYTRRSLLKWVTYPEEDIVVIHPAVSPAFKYARPRPHRDWSRLLQIGSTPNKNLIRLIEAVAGLDVTLIMIGQPSAAVHEALLLHQIRFENKLSVDDDALVECYRDSDILVFPSTYEGWGMPIIEAQATGRPVITGDVASMPEAAGGAACLVDPFDVASIRAGIVRVLSDEAYAQGLIQAGLVNARKYDVSKAASRYADLYQEISLSV
jgi:glycosyltransferase involved in cell wall biosynthesis